MGLRLPLSVEKGLNEAAEGMMLNSQDVLRLAAIAIVRCKERFNRVPHDMMIVQESYATRLEETQAPYSAENAKIPVDESVDEIVDLFIDIVKGHRLFRDRHLAPHFIPALRVALLANLSLAALGAGGDHPSPTRGIDSAAAVVKKEKERRTKVPAEKR